MQRGKKISKEDIEEIVRLRKEGYKIKHIAARLGVNKNTVVKYSKKVREDLEKVREDLEKACED